MANMGEQDFRTRARQGADARLDEALRQLLEVADDLQQNRGVALDLVMEDLLDVVMTRPLHDLRIQEVYIEATRSHPGRSVVVTATGLDDVGDPEPLDVIHAEDVSPSTLATQLLMRLRDRGLGGVRRVVSSAGTNLVGVVPAVFPDAGWLPLGTGERPSWLTLPEV